MEPDSINILADTITHFDTIQVHLIENLAISESSKSFIESIIKNETNKVTNYILPGISVLIALGALFLSFIAFKRSKTHNVISVKPLLIFRETTSHRIGKIRLYIANKGIGPLTFIDFYMVYEGNNYNKMWDIFEIVMKKFNYTNDDFVLNYRTFTNPLIDYSLKIDEEKILLKYHLKDKNQTISKEFFKEFKKIEFVYKYSDLYENIISDSTHFNN